MTINPREIAVDNQASKQDDATSQVTPEQAAELAKLAEQAEPPVIEPPVVEPVVEKKVNTGLQAHQEATKLMKEFTGQQFCNFIRAICYAAQGSGKSHSYGGMRTVGRTIDVDHFIEFSHADHRAIINKHGKETIILYDEVYPTIQVMKFLNEYISILFN